MKINLMIAFSNMLFSEGICRILSDDDSIKIVDILKSGTKYSPEKLKSLNVDIILVDLITLYNTFANIDTETDTARKERFILFDTECGRDNIVSTILTKKINGVLLGNATPILLKKAIHAVSKGDLWIDKSTIKNLLHGINTIGKDKTTTLSEQERKITYMIGKGFRNKEIAAKLHLSESTVKSHLHNIFHKLEVKNRAQLITFAIKNQNILTSSLP